MQKTNTNKLLIFNGKTCTICDFNFMELKTSYVDILVLNLIHFCHTVAGLTSICLFLYVVSFTFQDKKGNVISN